VSDDNKKFFEACRTMFLSDGWKAFQEEIQVGIQSINVASIESTNDFWKAKGRLETLAQIAGWQSAVLAAEEAAEEDEANA